MRAKRRHQNVGAVVVAACRPGEHEARQHEEERHAVVAEVMSAAPGRGARLSMWWPKTANAAHQRRPVREFRRTGRPEITAVGATTVLATLVPGSECPDVLHSQRV